jgi:hypothetical protein
MPYNFRKLPNKNLYRVYNTKTKEVHSYGTTLENAKKQIKLLNMIDAGVPLKKELQGGAITDIDKTSTGVLRIKLNDAAKNFLNNKLLPLISSTTIRITDHRVNTGKGRTQVFGYGSRRQLGFGEFSNNALYPELYRALLIFGKKVVPDYIPFTAIQVNHNYKTKKHIDKNNIGLSLAVSFGDFTGGELVIGKSEYQTKEHPVIFNGALTEHFNKPIKGNRYSLVYFISAPHKYKDEDIYKLHNKIFSSIKLMKGEGLIGGSIETDKFDERGIVSLPEFRSVNINLPTYMYKRLPDINGKPPAYRYRLVIPITSSRNLSSRKKETSLNINQKPVSKPIVDIIESEYEPNINDFSPADRRKIQTYYNKVKENERTNPNEIDKDDYEIIPRGRPLPCDGTKKSKNLGKEVKILSKEPKKLGKKGKKVELIIEEDEEPKQLGKEGSFLDNLQKQLKDKPKKTKQRNIEEPKEDLFAKLMEYEKEKPNEEKADLTKEQIISRIEKLEKEQDILTDKVNTTEEENNRWREIQDELQDLRFNQKNYDFVKDRKIRGKGLLDKNKILSNNRMTNPWIEYVKSYAAKNGMSYRDALRCPKCKAGYKKGGKVGMGVVDEIGNQDLLAEMYNDSELGANAGKKYISL